MSILIPLVLILVGLGGGIGAGLMLRPPPEPLPEAAGMGTGLPPCGPADAAHGTEPGPAAGNELQQDEAEPREFVKFANQFVVPVVTADKVSALVVLSLTLEVPATAAEEIYRLEPKFRDGFLRVMFDHANLGGFEGAFTGSNNMKLLHNSLLETARGIAGPDVIDVLISDYMRQDR
ncbi:flagellar basal body-associated protein FliL [Frigidibacter sp. MR17.24]